MADLQKKASSAPVHDLAKGHALVTGVSSGIGAAIALMLLEAGWLVTGVARRATDEAPLASFNGAYRHITADLSTAEGCDAVLAEVISKEASRDAAQIKCMSRITAFIHAAGILEIGALGVLDMGANRRMWALHVEAAERLANGLVPHLPEGARIVLIGSRVATGSATRSQYAASKAALIGMGRSWAAELITRGITVNIVSPAATDTPMIHDPQRNSLPPRTPPLGRFIAPEEIAGAVCYLLSPLAAPITGQVLTICGGSSL